MLTTRERTSASVLDYFGKRGMEYYNRGVYDKAALLLGRRLEQKPHCIKSRTFYGLSLFWLKRFEESITVLEECLASNMIFRELPLYLAYSYYSVGGLKSCVSICDNFLLNGSVSEECKRCARELRDLCEHLQRSGKSAPRYRSLKNLHYCHDLFDELLLKEHEIMRYF